MSMMHIIILIYESYDVSAPRYKIEIVEDSMYCTLYIIPALVPSWMCGYKVILHIVTNTGVRLAILSLAATYRANI